MIDSKQAFIKDPILSELMALDKIMPPAFLDKKILTAAHQSNSQKIKMGWKVPLSVAATVLLSVTLVLTMGISPETENYITSEMIEETAFFPSIKQDMGIQTESEPVARSVQPAPIILAQESKKLINETRIKNNPQRQEKETIVLMAENMSDLTITDSQPLPKILLNGVVKSYQINNKITLKLMVDVSNKVTEPFKVGDIFKAQFLNQKQIQVLYLLDIKIQKDKKMLIFNIPDFILLDSQAIIFR